MKVINDDDKKSIDESIHSFQEAERIKISIALKEKVAKLRQEVLPSIQQRIALRNAPAPDPSTPQVRTHGPKTMREEPRIVRKTPPRSQPSPSSIQAAVYTAGSVTKAAQNVKSNVNLQPNMSIPPPSSRKTEESSGTGSTNNLLLSSMFPKSMSFPQTGKDAGKSSANHGNENSKCSDDDGLSPLEMPKGKPDVIDICDSSDEGGSDAIGVSAGGVKALIGPKDFLSVPRVMRFALQHYLSYCRKNKCHQSVLSNHYERFKKFYWYLAAEIEKPLHQDTALCYVINVLKFLVRKEVRKIII